MSLHQIDTSNSAAHASIPFPTNLHEHTTLPQKESTSVSNQVPLPTNDLLHLGTFRLDGEGGSIIESVDHHPTPTLDTFIEVMRTIPDRSRVTVTARDIRDTHILQTYVVQLERHWSSEFKLWVRNDETGLWDPQDLGKASPPKPCLPITAKFMELSKTTGPAVDLIKSFVRVHYYMPVRVSPCVSLLLIVD